ncbi:uncharacterized protein Tco025E_05040 [Trypanosoma conorhini]|uniref:Uncharacterized protein n=1 Tax=Trypanosoma conorhini TaxID=83891 RepID=A0A3R7LLK1_9TRYP|nr:uncharacterized protein Tco025E_05040 [Trypanosoma conorhini]RNF16810.1 hypothetical protein Tco025E_05040 [Trypanosoma conorhini]
MQSEGGGMRSNRVDEALQLFAALQEKLRLESREGDINRVVRAASTEPSLRQSGGVTGAAALPPPPPPSTSSSRLRRPASVADLQRKLEVADGIMRRLHAKNQQLLQRLAAVRRAEEEATAGAVAQLRESLQQREEEVRRLRHRLRGSEKRAEGSGRGASGGGAALTLLKLRVRQMEEQYNRLLETRLTDALEERPAERVDAELRELVVLLKSRLLADARHHEAEVLLLNEALLESERRLATAPGA